MRKDLEIPKKESLTVEFKSDPKGGLSDKIVYETAVGLANAEGGTLYIGVDDDGTVSGLRSERWRDPERCAALIASHTVPPLIVSAEIIEVSSGVEILQIRVPKATGILATNDGKTLKRRLKIDKTPETTPLFPQEFITRLGDIGRIDYSSVILPNASCEDLSDAERQRLRQFVRDNHGEKILCDLEDQDLDKALGLVKSTPSGLFPTVAGLLLIGKEERLKHLLPGAGAVFQHLSGTDVLANDDFELPLLKCFEAMLDRFKARNAAVEITEGLARIPIPTFSERAFREALVNAFCHRDYTLLSRVSVRFTDDGLEITSPGGFVSGVSLENLLTVEPKPRNPLLADILKRLGLAERTGRGIDRIFEGNLLYGRPLPDYSESTSENVRVFFPKCDADVPFFKLILNYQRRLKRQIPIQSLMVLSALLFSKRLTFREIEAATHLPSYRLKRHVEALVEDGLIEAKGTGNNRDFILSSKFYQAQNREIAHVRQNAEGEAENEKIILQYVREKGAVTRGEAAEILGLQPQTAYLVLRKLTDAGILVRKGERRSSFYKLADQ